MSVARDGDFGRYATDIFTEEATEAIRNHRHGDDNPLFLYLAHLAVHSANTYEPLQVYIHTYSLSLIFVV